MKIYLDYVFLINFLFDFILLTGVALLLKRNIKLYRLIIGSIFGGLTIIILFLNLNSMMLFVLKIVSGIMMVIITFSFKNIKYTFNNFINLMISSVILGGSLYLININNYEYSGLLFFASDEKINIILLLIISIIILCIYLKTNINYQREFNKYYKIDIFIDNKKYLCNAYLDTGNKLIDPYFNKPIILTTNQKIKFKNIIYVPYQTLNNNGILECMLIDKIHIHNIGYRKKILIGRSNDKFQIEGIDMIISEKILEGSND